VWVCHNTTVLSSLLKNLKEKWWQMKKYYVHNKIWSLMPHHLCIWTRQKNWVLYIDHWIFFPAQWRVIENLLIHIRKKSAYIQWKNGQISTLNCHNWLKTYVLNTHNYNWFNVFLKENSTLCNPSCLLPTVFHIEKVISFLSQKVLSCPF